VTINIASGSNFDLSTLPFDIDNLTLIGSGNINAVGNSIANLIIGNSANNVIDGGTAGADTLKGGKGNDTYLINHSGIFVIENLSEGIDIVQSSVDYTLGLNLENLTLTGTTATKAYGNISNNLITGNTLANIISGGGGKDTLVGGIGNDTYLISNTGVIITENSGQGTDIVESTVSFTLLADGLDNLTLAGSAIIGKGNGGSNIITGNSKNNILDGGTSVMGDTLIGGLGNDTYIVSGSADKIFESVGQGTDTVISSISYTLSNTQELENLTITGTADTAIGNSLTNIITGNSLNNTLSPGGGGNDILIGGKGNDGYFVLNSSIVVKENFGEGTDTVLSNVSYTLTNNVENLTLANITGAIIGAGNSFNNTIIGNTFDNLISSGGGGKDTLYGGIGNDTYLISNTGVTITENSGQGTDIVESTVSFTLSNNVENLTLTGSGAINGTGTSLANIITGNSKNNILDTGGGAGINDTLFGGKGNDTYIVSSEFDVLVELSNEGTDLVLSRVSLTLENDLENLTLVGSSTNATGNTLNNIIKGNSIANILDGGIAGTDTLSGLLGNDTYLINHSGVVITELAVQGTDLVSSIIDYTLGLNIENLTLTGTTATKAYGNILNNLITGNTLANLISSGGAGKDTLAGGTGNDTYLITNTGITITENAGQGTDIVESTVSFTLSNNVENLALTASGAINGTGNSLANIITGNSKNNVLSGKLNSLLGDTLIGGKGNDTYILGQIGDSFVEQLDEGTDLIITDQDITLSNFANIENLTLIGSTATTATGTTVSNFIKGNSIANILDGGTAGTDTLSGLLGNDTYLINHSGVVITELAVQGTDLVSSSIDYTLGLNIENLTLSGTTATKAYGNILNNLITGNTLANLISSGGAGKDTLAGGIGNDTYLITNTGVTITENAGQGTDIVESTVSFTLGNEIENVTLTGSGSIKATGNAGSNLIIGNSKVNILYGLGGDDTLIGGRGNDTLTGGDGDDIYIFSADDDIDTINADAAGTNKVLFNNADNSNIAIYVSGSNLIMSYATDNTDIVTIKTYSGITEINDSLGDILGSDEITAIKNDIVAYNLAHPNSVKSVQNVRSASLTDVFGGLTLMQKIASEWAAFGGPSNVVSSTADGDTLVGSTANDTYIISHNSVVISENPGEGTDLIKTSVNYTMGANVENITLTGAATIAAGNSLSNKITANSLNSVLSGGTYGNDTFIGGVGNDSIGINYCTGNNYVNSGDGNNTIVTYYNSGNNKIINGSGNDTYDRRRSTGNNYINLGNGTNFITDYYDLGDNTIIGGANDDGINFKYNTGNNYLSFGDGQNGYTIRQGMTNNTIIGGNDYDNVWIYYNPGDNVISLADGNDVINYEQTSGNIYADLGAGNDIVNLPFDTGNMTIIGGAGNDTISEALSSGTIILKGGSGDDLYSIDNSSITIVENTAEGTDTIKSTVDFTLSNNIENLILLNSTAISATGNSLGNTITGNTFDNIIDGAEGADTLLGGTGNDTFIGGTGDDIYQFALGDDIDTVSSDAAGTNKIKILNVGKSNIAAFVSGSDLILSYAADDSDIVTIKNYSGIAEIDDYISYTLSSTEISAIQSDITAYNAAHPGSVNSVQDVRSASFTDVFGGLTLMEKIASEWGGSGSGAIKGDASDNVLTSIAFGSCMIGYAGNDTYIINNSGVSIVENTGEGADVVQSNYTYTLDNNVENLILIGSQDINGIGNSLDNYIQGNSHKNMLYGGIAGNDTLVDGQTYIVDRTNITIIDNYQGETDNVYASINYTLANNLEYLTLTGNAIIGVGNSMGNNITGNSLNNILDGGIPVVGDLLQGLAGDDTYIVNNTNTSIYENSGNGTDLVISSVSYTLGNYMENLTLTGTAATAKGNSLSNIITGNSVANIIIGGLGNDTLQGAAGNDLYQFSANDDIDTITQDTSGTNTVTITDIFKANIAVYNSGADLILSYAADNTDILTLKNYATSISQINDSGGSKLTSAQITAIINDIAAYNSVYPGAVNSVQDVRSTSYTDVAGFGGLTLMQKIASEWV